MQLSLTSLEEVFLAIARQAEIDFAQASGQTTQSVTADDGAVLQARFWPPLLAFTEPRSRYAARLFV